MSFNNDRRNASKSSLVIVSNGMEYKLDKGIREQEMRFVLREGFLKTNTGIDLAHRRVSGNTDYGWLLILRVSNLHKA